MKFNGTLIDGFTLNKTLSIGRNSTVYQGVRLKDKMPVVIKAISEQNYTPDNFARYNHEFKLVHALPLQHSIRIYDLIHSNDYAALILEDIQGLSLDRLINKNNLNLEEKLKIAIKIIQAIQELHNSNILHKDINPKNIIWNASTQELKITDFGISTKLSLERFDNINPQLLEGTIEYLSPEQTGRINRSVDYRSDYYALGVTLYELFTGFLPFLEKDTMKLIHAHIAKEPTPPELVDPIIPKAISEIILKLLAKQAEERYSSAQGIKYDLEYSLKQLQTNGLIKPFSLGAKDVKTSLELTEKIYGREKELKLLSHEVNVAANGKKCITWITGYSGIGKTSIVRELYRNIALKSGYLLTGKYDQLHRNIPYHAFRQIFEQWVKIISADEQNKIKYFRKRIYNALGEHGKILSTVIPELELIVGKHEDSHERMTVETQDRFKLLFTKLMSTICQKKHPLVIYLDDLQWADSASLSVLQSLITDEGCHYIYIIGAYRDNEINNTHPLTHLFSEFKKQNIKSNTIKLHGLTIEDVGSLLSNVFKQTEESLKPLINLVYKKTEGNPFYLNQFLYDLYNKKYLYYSNIKQNWDWDMDAILMQPLSANVVELMTSRIQNLNEQTQNLLKQAACMGNRFSLDSLALISEQSLESTAAQLYPALDSGLILPLDGKYKFIAKKMENKVSYSFLHDRVQQAALALLNKQEKQQCHLRIANYYAILNFL